VITRWFWHFIAGVIFWGSYAPKGMSPYWYSFVLNGTSALANAILLSIILVVLVKKAPRLLNP
jgi:thiamine transporter